MKEPHVLLSAIILMTAFGVTANAAPVTFSFSGEVFEVSVEDGAVDPGVTVGDPASYSLLIDFDRLGTQTTWDGAQYVTVELDVITYGVDTFYAEYLDGFLIEDGLIAAGEPNPTIFNYGFSFIAPPMMLVGSQNHGLTLFTLDGINWLAEEQAFDANGTPDLILIKSGGTFAPVPIPAAAWLFGSAIVGMVSIARRRRLSA